MASGMHFIGAEKVERYFNIQLLLGVGLPLK